MGYKAKHIEALFVPFGISAEEMDQRSRALRNAGYLPSGGRGQFGAPDVSAEHGANMLLGLVSSEIARTAHLGYGIAKRLSRPSGTARVDRRLGEAIEIILSSPKLARSVIEFRYDRKNDFAAIVYDDGATEWFSGGGLPDDEVVRKQTGVIRAEVVIPVALIVALADAFAEAGELVA